MAAVPTNEQVQEMVKQAMRDRAPPMYRELVARGELDRVAKERADLFDEIYYGISAEAMTKTPRPEVPWEERVRVLEEMNRSAVEQALAFTLEFPVEPRGGDEDEDIPDDFEIEEAADWIAANR